VDCDQNAFLFYYFFHSMLPPEERASGEPATERAVRAAQQEPEGASAQPAVPEG